LLISLAAGGSYYAYVAKCSPSGSNLWLTPAAIKTIVALYPLALDAVGNAYVTGQTDNNAPMLASGIFMFATNGAIVWSNNYSTPVGPSAGTAITTDIAGNAYVTGYSAGTTSSNDIITLAYDHNGNQLWLQRYNGPGNGDDRGVAIAVDNSGNVYVTGYETAPGGGTEMVLIKYAPVTVQPQSRVAVQKEKSGANEKHGP